MRETLTWSERLEEGDNVVLNASAATPFETLFATRLAALASQPGLPAGVAALGVAGVVGASLFSGKALTRRAMLKGAAASVALAGLTGAAGSLALGARPAQAAESSLSFPVLPQVYDETSHVAQGYEIQTLIRWGDPVVAGAPAFDVHNQTAEAQSQQFGYNNDFVGFMPLPLGSTTSDHGLLCVNHEYTNPHMMFPGLKDGEIDKLTKEQVDIEMAAHGHAVIEIKRGADGTWTVVKDSPYNRRFTALATEFRLTGPAAGSDRLKTSADPTGTTVIGTVNNCAGGKTPWGTILFAEENFHGYFMGDIEQTPEAANYKRLGVGAGDYAWGKYHDRFDVTKEPNEPNRFGWMVEYDPYDPNSVPKKRTTLGRFKHEGATTALNKDGHVVVYTGDDQRFEYIYRFITKGKYNPTDRAANMDLLDEGTLSVAKLNADGTLQWLPLVFGQGPLTPENGFHSQGDVLIETRRAADLMGATPMDRPEDVEPNPVNGVIYAMLTNNTKRKDDQLDAANPRAINKHGHVIELIPPGTAADGMAANADHTADTFTWDVFLLAGDPSKPEDGAKYGGDVGPNGWLSCPDNLCFDSKGRIWISTDGAPKAGIADGVWAADVAGPGRAITRRFYACPRGAELCGPEFTPDDSAYFAAVQHPGEEPDSTFDAPSTRWPDFQDTMPPRPAIQVLVKTGGGPIG